MYSKYFKIFLDYGLALIAVVILFPFIILISALILFTMGGPVIFSQERGGKNGKTFRLYKFRTMSGERNDHGELLEDEYRLTKLGKFLRSTSLDELPGLINVLRGEMSFVGPRPFVAQYLPLYNQFQRRRHEVLPGITGWAQISGRNKLSWEEKFELDVWYVDNRSLFLDFKILFLTVRKVILRDGITNKGSERVESFQGNNKS